MGTVRKLQLADLAAILEVEQADSYSPWTERLLKDCLNREHYYNWALEVNSQFAGYLIASLAAGECHIMVIAIVEQFRRQGYAQQLLCHLKQKLQGKVEYIILEVRQENLAAQQLYEKLGFKQIGLRRGYYQQGDGNRDALVYRLEI